MVKHRNELLKEELMVIWHIIYNVICLWMLNKHVLLLKLMFWTFISWNEIWYSCNMNFWWQNKRGYYVLLCCFFQSVSLPVLHWLFSGGQKRWILGKKFLCTNFRFFTPFAGDDFQWFQLESTNYSTSRVLSKETRTFENLLFLALIFSVLKIFS